METQVVEKGDIVVVRVQGRVDAASTPQLEKQINAIIDSAHFKILLNMADVDYLSSAGLRLILSLKKKLEHLEGKLIACNLNEEVTSVFKMAGFHNVIEIYPTEEESFNHL